MKAAVAGVLCCFLLSACGFHLRSYGEMASTINEVSLSCSHTNTWALCLHLKQTLLLHDIRLHDAAPLTLVISPMVQKSRVLSLQANASAAELGLNSEISYRLITAHNDQVKHQQSVSVNNSYRHQSTALLAKDRERDELQKQLSQQLAEEIVRQISVLDTSSWFEQTNNEADTMSRQGN